MTFKSIFKRRDKLRLRRSIFCLLIPIFIFSSIYIPSSAYALDTNHSHKDVTLTQWEKNYIKNNPEITVANYPGNHPILGKDGKGNPIGISYEVLKLIEEQSGLKFKIKDYDSLQDAIEGANKGEVQIISTLSDRYKNKYFPYKQSSKPYLVSKSVLVYRENVDLTNIEKYDFAAAKGSTIPDLAKKSNIQYYTTWENCLVAVSSKNSDFTLCNELSFTHYIHELSITNLKSIPIENSINTKMFYSFIYIDENPTLNSIINKYMSNVCDIDLQGCMLRGITSISDSKNKFESFWIDYKYIFGNIILLAIAIFFILYIYTLKQTIEINTLNNLIFSLSSVSNEYIFLYNTKKNQIKLVKQFVDILNNMKETHGQLDSNSSQLINPSTTNLNKDILDIFTGKSKVDEITLHSLDGISYTFRVYQNIETDSHNNMFTIGKFVDITEAKLYEEKAKCDSMTGLYNALTTKNIIKKSLANMYSDHMSALFIIDIDHFKFVNDAYGHMKGDETIKVAADTFKTVFRSSDIIGRIGGDEFCVFISGPLTLELIQRKSEELKKVFTEKTEKIDVKASLSIGVSIQTGSQDFVKVFNNADIALYHRKNHGRDGYTIARL